MSVSNGFTWTFGNPNSELYFEIIYNQESEQLNLKMIEGEMDLNALWISDGSKQSAKLSKKHNSLNMNGEGSIDGEGNQINWNDYKLISLPGLRSAGKDKPSYLAKGEIYSLEPEYLKGLDLSTLTLGIRATSVEGLVDSDSLKLNSTSTFIKKTGSAIEDSTFTSSGNITADGSGVIATAGEYSSAYGSVSVNTDGTWIFSLDNDAAQEINQGETRTEVFTIPVTLADSSTSTETITITIDGVNDAPVITNSAADAAGAVIEDGTSVAMGTLTSTDVDTGSTATWSGDATGTYGSIAINSSGVWTYTLDNSLPVTQALAEGQVETDVFTMTVTDDNGATATQDVAVTITGTNDAPVITNSAADAAGAVIEDGTSVAMGTLTSTDVDTGSTATWSGDATGTYGSIAINSSGVWTYTLDNSLPVTQALAEGQVETDVFTMTVTDDNGATATQDVTITINGADDALSLRGIVIDADAFAAGTDISNAYAGATLSTERGGAIYASVARNGWSTSGTNWFSRSSTTFPTANNFGTDGIRVDFDNLMNSVSVDVISDDSKDAGRLQIFDSSDNLIGSISTGDFGPGGAVKNLTLDSGSTNEIAYAVMDYGPTLSATNFDTIIANRIGGYASDHLAAGSNVGITSFGNSTFARTDVEPYNLSQATQSFGYNTSFFSGTDIGTYLADKDALIISEVESGSSLPSGWSSAIADWVNAGGTLVTTSSSNGQDTALINSAFGHSIVDPFGGSFGGAVNSSLNTDAITGTVFADNTLNAPTLSDNSAIYTSLDTTTLPLDALTLYTRDAGTSLGGTSMVTGWQQGAGQVTMLGFDFFNAAPFGSQDGGWIEVLKDSLST